MSERPETVPEKFWDATTGTVRTDVVLSSYLELEKKLSAPSTPAPEIKIEAQKGISEEDINLYAQRYSTNGTLSEQDYAELLSKGLPRSAVDDIIAGRTAKVNNYRNEVIKVAGGDEAYKLVSTWAANTLSKAELDAYNAAVSGGNIEQAKLAVTALTSKYESANGKHPTLVSGSSNAVADGYTSKAQMVTDMRKPEYQRDPAFRALVASKLQRSSF